MHELICLSCQKQIETKEDTVHFHLYNFCELCYMDAYEADEGEAWAKGC